ncbi:SDR family NAD(P)-dependent oxidoreductase [Advenella sp. FME57]|uniref:Short-chain dehydrogenase n=1 Tax=Advenella kashmirensis TaxID=310575 RepID=A0A356LGJ6_9BURK|nr:SDR family NAD(P)-dependent oxidoreductase [Advenella sp. FME57]HBP29615.1 short-chain dehydrogenase [Advenella kashmirensis]
MMNFEGQVALITGSGRGLGLAYARCIGQLGAKVLIQDLGADINGDGQDPQVAERAAEQLRLEGLKAEAICGTISSRDACHDLITRALKIDQRLDALVHNAGWVGYENIEALQEHSFDRMIAVTVKAPLWLAQASWPIFKAANYGRIVITTSCRALFPHYAQNGLTSYAAAKMAAVGLVNVLACEGKQHGILVNAISPVAKTRMWGINTAPDELRPSEVAPGLAYLASPHCADTGWILRAANGQFHATRAQEAAHVDYPRNLRAIHATTMNEVAANWSKIAIVNGEPR